MQISIQNEKQDQLLNLETHVSSTEGKIQAWQESNAKKFTAFKEKVTECLKYIETDKQARDFEHLSQLREVEALEKQINDKFHAEKLARKDMEAKLLQHVEDRFMAVRKLLSQESRNRYESIEQLKGSLENDMPRLQDII